jgi:hypothetical protein
MSSNAFEINEFGGGLLRGKGRNKHIVLVPQPISDPNDPFNWPNWKIDVLLGGIAIAASVIGYV